jgi:hypothetical protein
MVVMVVMADLVGMRFGQCRCEQSECDSRDREHLREVFHEIFLFVRMRPAIWPLLC